MSSANFRQLVEPALPAGRTLKGAYRHALAKIANTVFSVATVGWAVAGGAVLASQQDVPCDAPLPTMVFAHIVVGGLYAAARAAEWRRPRLALRPNSVWLLGGIVVVGVLDAAYLFVTKTCADQIPPVYTFVLWFVWFHAAAAALAAAVAWCGVPWTLACCAPHIARALGFEMPVYLVWPPGDGDGAARQRSAPSAGPRSRACSVCLADYADGDKLQILRCSHLFHDACIEPWLKTNRTCPLCRLDTS